METLFSMYQFLLITLLDFVPSDSVANQSVTFSAEGVSCMGVFLAAIMTLLVLFQLLVIW